MYRVAQSVVFLVGAYLLLSGRPLFGLFLLFSAFGYWFFDRYTNRVVKGSERKPREETSDFHDELFVADLHEAISANPLIQFSLVANDSGILKFIWFEDGGEVYSTTRKLRVS